MESGMVRGGDAAQEGLSGCSRDRAGLGWGLSNPCPQTPSSSKGGDAGVRIRWQGQWAISEMGGDRRVRKTSQRPYISLPRPSGRGPGPSPFLPCAAAGMVCCGRGHSGGEPRLGSLFPLGRAC